MGEPLMHSALPLLTTRNSMTIYPVVSIASAILCGGGENSAVHTVCTCYSYTTSCCGLSGIHEAVIQLEAKAQPRLLIE